MKKRIIKLVLANVLSLFTLAGCGSGASSSEPAQKKEVSVIPTEVNAPTEEESEPQVSNITGFSFSNTKDIEIKAGKTQSCGWVQPSLQKEFDFSIEDVMFLSEDPSIASIAFTNDALTTYLYFDVTGVSAGETYVYVQSTDGQVTSEKIKMIVTGESGSATPADTPTEITATPTETPIDEVEENPTLPELTFVELDELQKLFCNMPSLENRDGSIEKMGYATGGSVYSIDKFELTYIGGQFYYDGQAYENGEDAMQLYLANQ